MADRLMDHARAQAWLDRYVAAWKSYDEADIAALFSEDVRYRYYPHADWVVGREAVVASWLGESTDAQSSTRDEPGTYDATYTPIAVDGDVVVATGTSTYTESPGGPATKVFDNCFVMRFDDQDRCREFTEYYTKRT
ncbi:nuclear transport factor 2 family protein [Nocardioides sp.]|uniref:nuclear transport factor 2 family protein n=1 Tax=Nocardioides sp. TaxID=35761 RepID=UPI002F3E39E0